MIRAFEMDLKDSAEFDAWKKKQDALEEENRLAMIERRRQEMAASAEAAELDAKEKFDQNKKSVAKMKEESEQLAEKARQEKIKQEQLNQAKHETIDAMKQHAQEAVALVAQEKKESALQIQQARLEMAAQVAKEKQEEAAQKKELIKKIKAMEAMAAVRARRPKIIDPTSTSGIGLLEEMSLIELRQRVESLRKQEQEEQERKRTHILEEKHSKQTTLDALQRVHAVIRKHRVAEDNMLREKRRTNLQKEKSIASEKEQKMARLIDSRMSARHEEKLAEATRLAAEVKRHILEMHFHSVAKTQMKTPIPAPTTDDRHEKQRQTAQQDERFRKNRANDTKRERTEKAVQYDSRTQKANEEVQQFEEMQTQVRQNLINTLTTRKNSSL
eukprot:TRINITY_DN3374_c0_g1_i1.p1 TRINITY_DN3374_c0_g1~~TRINITY_DN3374_c0_g1_i1.p1  ORF type:complete len:412 (+),score=134.01 TRINITY_DN3374_c0_g1_i1:76-1236(+)